MNRPRQASFSTAFLVFNESLLQMARQHAAPRPRASWREARHMPAQYNETPSCSWLCCCHLQRIHLAMRSSSSWHPAASVETLSSALLAGGMPGTPPSSSSAFFRTRRERKRHRRRANTAGRKPLASRCRNSRLVRLVFARIVLTASNLELPLLARWR